MIWEQHTLVIVMTTRVMERGRPKCHQYWETEEGAEATYGYFTVRTVAVETDPNYVVTTISLTNKKVWTTFATLRELFLRVFCCITDGRVERSFSLAVYVMARLRGAVISQSNVGVLGASETETGQYGERVRRYVGGASARTAYCCPLQCRDWSNG